MRQKIILIGTLILFKLSVLAQINNLPIKEWNSTGQTPLIFYISGDGGNDNFSIKMCKIINESGYGITALNARNYFWNPKTPEQIATDITTYLEKEFQNRINQQFILVGYSFGSDVLPFMINKLSDSIKGKLKSVVLLSPSKFTYLKIRGHNKKESMDVSNEINKMISVKTTTIFGSNENTFPLKSILLKNYNNEILPGGHHFDGNIVAVTKTIMKYF